MDCSNCYSGCTHVTSDKCVKYTGMDNEILGIKNGDSQSYVNQVLMGFVTANSDGTGIKFTLAPEDTCSLITDGLQNCKDVTVVDYVRALSIAVCSLVDRITTNEDNFSTLEADYLTGCIEVDASAGTHAVLQATIVQTCINTTAIEATNLNLSTNYVAIADIAQYIEDYIANSEDSNVLTGVQTKMVPYTVVEYYGSLSYFDATGAGMGDWANIYLCNGNNTTPDKRGRTAVGTTSGMGGGAFSPSVDPSLPGNPSYSLRSTAGSNSVTLNATQIPSHTHTGDTTTDPGHTHNLNTNTIMYKTPSGERFEGGGSNEYKQGYNDPTAIGGSHKHTFTTNSSGGGGSHANIQPVIACHYIMYIPAT